jgi:hypothetical protein
MKLSSTKRIESQEIPGVAFTVKRISAKRRDDLDELTAPVAEKMEGREEYADLSRERVAAKEAGEVFPTEKELRWLTLNMQAGRLYSREALPAIVRYCLVSIEGLDIDGKPATADALSECSEEADRLYSEIVREIEKERGLTAPETKNSDSLSTSAAPEGGKTDPAVSVESAETITASAA